MREHRPASVDITHITLSVLFIALFIASTFWVLSPFLMSILWATIVSVATWPFLMRLEAFLGRRRLAVAIMTALILLVVFVPVTLALTTIVRNAQGITEEIRSLNSIELPAAPAWLEHVPVAPINGAGSLRSAPTSGRPCSRRTCRRPSSGSSRRPGASA